MASGKSRKGSSRKGGSSRNTASGRQPSISPAISHEAVGWCVFLILLILTLGIYLKSSLGAFGTLINTVFVGVFGFGAYVISVYSLVVALWFLFGHITSRARGKIVLGYVAIILLCALIHVLTGARQTSIALMYHAATIRSGGVVGGVIGSGLMKVFGKVGSAILLIFLLVILLILITELSLVSGVRRIGKKTKDGSDRLSAYAKAKAQERRAIREEKMQLKAEMEKQKAQEMEEAREAASDHDGFLAKAAPYDGQGSQMNLSDPGIDPSSPLEPDMDQPMESDFSFDGFYQGGASEEEASRIDPDARLQSAMAADRQAKSFQKDHQVKRPGPIKDGIVDIPLIINDPYVARQNDPSAPSQEITFSTQKVYTRDDEPEPFDETPPAENVHLTPISPARKTQDRPSAAKEPNLKDADTIRIPQADDGSISTSRLYGKEEFPSGQNLDEGKNHTIGQAALNGDKKPGPTGKYVFPPLNLLSKPSASGDPSRRNELIANSKMLEEVLLTYGVEAKVVQVNRGPAVTRYEVQPKRGTSVKKIASLDSDIAMALAATSIHIEAPIPGKSAVGIEVPNKETTTVTLREVIDSDVFRKSSSKLTFTLGKDLDGQARVADIAKMPHLLIAGATGSGKSVCINSMIMSILYKAHPNDVKLIMIDPKVVELQVYNGIPHLLLPVVNDTKQASATLNWAVQEMQRRYKKFAQYNVRDIRGFNEAVQAGRLEEEENMPQIVIIIDELADLMMAAAKEVETSICRLAQMARAAGMHLVIATQRPSVDVITGLIKANIPSRIAFAVSSSIDSKTILGYGGAEKLLGKGDMLFAPIGASHPVRIQGTFVSDQEVENVVAFVKGHMEAVYDDDALSSMSQTGGGTAPGGDPEEEIDEYLEDAVRIVVEKQKASISMLQRAFRIGFNRAARLMDALEARGVVGPDEGSKPRQVLMTKEEWENENS